MTIDKPYPPTKITFTDWDDLVDAIEARLGDDATGDLLMADTKVIKTGVANDDNFIIKVVDNDTSTVTKIGIIQGASNPWIAFGGSDELKVFEDGTATFGITLTGDWDIGANKLTAEQLESDVATSTPPLIVASTTVIPNLNADLLDGNHASAFTSSALVVLRDGTQALSANWDAGIFDIRSATVTADALTSGRVVFAGANGLLSDDSDFTFSVDTLTVTKIAGTQFTGAITGGQAGHDQFSDTVSAEHVDHSGVTYTAGDGLTGGGTAEASRTFAVGAGTLIDVTADAVDVDLSELATSTADGDGDFFVVVDAGNAQKKLTKANIALSGFNNDLTAVAAHVLATSGPHSDSLPLVDLAPGARGEIIVRGAADWEALGVGTASDVLTSGGAGADVVWAAAGAPGAHESTHVKGGADDIDSALDARAIGLTAQGEIVYHAAAANTLATLAVGTSGQALLSGGSAADVSWGAPAPAAHESSHNDGGTDEIEVDTLAGANGASGEIVESDGAAMSFVEPDGRYDPKAHATTHESGGSDEIRDIEMEPGLGDETADGLKALVTVGENVVTGDTLYLKADGKYWKSDADSGASMPAKVLVVDATIAADATGTVLHEGYYRNNDLYAWTLGNGEANLLFADVNPGLLVQFAGKPSGAGDQVQVCGWVVDADTIYWRPSLELVEVSA